MFVVRNAIKNALRYYKKNILNLFVCMAMLLFLFSYVTSIFNTRQQLQNLCEVIPVTARVSNSVGNQDMGLKIDFAKIEAVRQTGMIKNEIISSQTYVSLIGDTIPNEKKRPPYSYVGVNTLSAFTAFNESDVTYLEGTESTIWETQEPVCVLRDTYLNAHGLKIGDNIQLDVFAPQYNTEGYYTFLFQPLGVFELKIVGSYDSGTVLPSDELPDIISPLGTVTQIYKKADVAHYASSFRFAVDDPRNMNEFKEKMEQLDFNSINPQAVYSRIGNTLVVNDETFVLSATQIQKTIVLLQSLFPLLIILIITISFVISFLLMQARKKEIAIMRSMGTPTGKIFVMVLLEGIIPLILGTACTTFLFLFVGSGTSIPTWLQISITLFFMMLYLLGIVIAVLLTNKKTVLVFLSKLD